MSNLETYSDGAVVGHYAAASNLLPPERYLFEKHFRPGLSVLDVGVGGGRTAPHLSLGAARYLGVDYSVAMIEACRVRFPSLEFMVADASDLSSIADGSFNLVVFSFNGIDYLPDDASRRRALSEFRRVTKPDGWIIISSHNARQLIELPNLDNANLLRKFWRILRAIGRSVRRLFSVLPHSWFWNGHGYMLDSVHGGLRTHVSSPASIAIDCAKAGLKIEEAVGALHPRRVPRWADTWTTYALCRCEST